ncbi:hypothetical protein MANI_001275 [Metarhizium anisopliae]|nr:hypothetical protein MANI_001275 [Metarhizium anisopliae]
MDWRASTVEDASIDSTVASEVREVRMREDPVGTSASQASCCGQGPGTHSARAAVQAHGAWPVWSLLSICTTGHQASTGLLLGRRASTRSMFGPLLTRTHRDAPELSTKMHAGGPCQKPPPPLERSGPTLDVGLVSSSPQAPSSLQLGAVMAVERHQVASAGAGRADRSDVLQRAEFTATRSRRHQHFPDPAD